MTKHGGNRGHDRQRLDRNSTTHRSRRPEPMTPPGGPSVFKKDNKPPSSPTGQLRGNQRTELLQSHSPERQRPGPSDPTVRLGRLGPAVPPDNGTVSRKDPGPSSQPQRQLEIMETHQISFA